MKVDTTAAVWYSPLLGGRTVRARPKAGIRRGFGDSRTIERNGPRVRTRWEFGWRSLKIEYGGCDNITLVGVGTTSRRSYPNPKQVPATCEESNRLTTGPRSRDEFYRRV